MSALLSVLLVCIALTASGFAQDLPEGSCQASNSLSVLVQGRNVIAYVPKGAWSTWDVQGITNKIDVLNIEGREAISTEDHHAEHGEVFPGCQEFFFARQKTRRPVAPGAGSTHPSRSNAEFF